LVGNQLYFLDSILAYPQEKERNKELLSHLCVVSAITINHGIIDGKGITE
jgi:hypothetical protein